MSMKKSIVILIIATLLSAWGCVVHPRNDYQRRGYYHRYDDRYYYDYDHRGRYRYDYYRYRY
ncbi:MAG: hypothetical protein RBS57_03115 [Desulforhabdus sp.]|jgi:hypothetical protein|nr:hypothetical protein [Desulforhabdus sp.]